MNKVIWSFNSHCDYEQSVFTVGKLVAVVQDNDGDVSVWEIKENGFVLAKGEVWQRIGMPYHFDTAKDMCIDALIPLAKERKLYNDNGC